MRSILILIVLAVHLTGWIAAPPAAAGENGNGYRIGADDLLNISVWDNKDLDRVVFVRPDGRISLPLIGDLEVAGLTVGELTQRLDDLYETKIKGAQVTVGVQEIRSRGIFFIGGVAKPGAMQLTQEFRLLQAISLAGGVVQGADLESSFVLRRGERLPVDFVRLIRQGDSRDNILLEPADTIVVPIADVVYVQGEVRNPGAYKLSRDLTVLKAVAQAGGFAETASAKRVTLVGSDGVRRAEVVLRAGGIQAQPEGALGKPLSPDDVVTVSSFLELVFVQGEVKTPGAMKFTTDLTLLKAIAQGGGFTNLAASKRVTILRGHGTTKENIRVNVSELMSNPDAAADMPLRPDDIIIVPQRLF
jgi:polysaccharide export outer membrane protein